MIAAFWGLALVAFLAATILPFSSELAVTGMVAQGYPVAAVVLVATIGNVLGSLTNYALGRWAGRAAVIRLLRVTEDSLSQAEDRFKRYGTVALLLAWVPVIGDPLTVIAGVLRVKVGMFVLLVTVGKCARYAVIAGAVSLTF